MEQPVTLVSCDRCQCGRWPEFEGEAERGFLIGDHEQALTKGWQETDYGVICPRCVLAEAEEVEDAENVEHGAVTAQTMVETLGGGTEDEEGD